MPENVTAVPTSDTGNASVVLWVLQIAAALVFLFDAGATLIGTPDKVILFLAIGVGQWFRYVTGMFELVGAIGLIAPSMAGIAAALLAAVMAGAVVMRLFVIGGSPLAPFALFVLLAILIWARRPRRLVLAE